MTLYCGIDLHSNNSVVSVIDDNDRVVAERRLSNDLLLVLEFLSPYAQQLWSVVIESTFNWYWLVDGLIDAGYQVRLANTTAIQQYSGLKHVDDHHDARWLAHMERLGILKVGYIYPREEREIRDLLRQRNRLVQQRTAQILSLQTIVSRQTGRSISCTEVKKLAKAAERWPADSPLGLALGAHIAVLRTLDEQIESIQKAVLARAKPRPVYKALQTIVGVGKVLGLTILLESGDMSRFKAPGNFASYCRCVESKRLSNGKKKGENNTKNGNKYLAWAFVEAANFAIRYSVPVQRFYERKKAKRNATVAIKAVAHKLARAAYYVMRDNVPFDINKAFA